MRKELNESLVWLCTFERQTPIPPEMVELQRVESDELCRIIAESKKTAECRLKQERVGQGEL